MGLGLGTSSTSAPVFSHSAEMALMLEMRCASKACGWKAFGWKA